MAHTRTEVEFRAQRDVTLRGWLYHNMRLSANGCRSTEFCWP